MYNSFSTLMLCMSGTPTALQGGPWIIHRFFFSPSPFFILFFLHFAGWMCVCLSLCVNVSARSLVLPLFLFYYSQTAVRLCSKGKRNDRSSEQLLKKTFSTPCFVFHCSSYLHSPTSLINTLISSLCFSPQIPTPWASTALTTLWSEEWWPWWSLSRCV